MDPISNNKFTPLAPRTNTNGREIFQKIINEARQAQKFEAAKPELPPAQTISQKADIPKEPDISKGIRKGMVVDIRV